MCVATKRDVLRLMKFSEKRSDGKSFVNPTTNVPSRAYQRFVQPIDNGERGGFDVHIYYFQVRVACPQGESVLTSYLTEQPRSSEVRP